MKAYYVNQLPDDLKADFLGRVARTWDGDPEGLEDCLTNIVDEKIHDVVDIIENLEAVQFWEILRDAYDDDEYIDELFEARYNELDAEYKAFTNCEI